MEDGFHSYCDKVCSLIRRPSAREAARKELLAHLEKNTGGRGAQHAVRFRGIDGLIRQVLDTRLEQTLGVSGPDGTPQRLELLCLLFDHSRKEGMA